MSRGIEETEMKCPICGTFLSMDISGVFELVDHDFGFTDSGMADGYTCENEHTIVIKTSDDIDEDYEEYHS